MMDVGIAIMGYGVVGKGVAHAIRENGRQIEKRAGVRLRLLRVLDLLDFPGDPAADIMTRDVRDILGDRNVNIVVETMGGLKAAYGYTEQALSAGKHVVTSNKELVAEYGPELLAIAKKNGVSYRFDASVGGGIPLIAPMTESLSANNIGGITGILNGTTNFMLSHMRTHGAQFSETLSMARELGYAEGDPSADIEGKDACRKLAILSSAAWGKFLDWKLIHTEGIGNISAEDVAYAVDLGRVIKLVASSRLRGDGMIEAFVTPAMLDRRDPLACVEGVNNAVIFHCDLNGDIMLYGQGAGMIPTGGAVIADVVKAATEKYGRPGADFAWDRTDALEYACFDGYTHGYYARVTTADSAAYPAALFREFPEARILPPSGERDTERGITGTRQPLAFTVPISTEGEFAERLARANGAVAGSETAVIIRII